MQFAMQKLKSDIQTASLQYKIEISDPNSQFAMQNGIRGGDALRGQNWVTEPITTSKGASYSWEVHQTGGAPVFRLRALIVAVCLWEETKHGDGISNSWRGGGGGGGGW